MKRFFCMLLVLLVSLFTFGQTDVTQYYLENAGFDSNYDYAASQTNAVAQEIKTIDGWTAGHNLNYTIAGVYQIGFQGTYNNAKVPGKGYDNETTGGGLALSTGWGNDFPYYQIVTLPKGTYTISAPTYNGKNVAAGTSLLAWIPNSGDAVKSTVAEYPVEKWVLDKITFTLSKPTTGKIQIGYKAAAGSSASSCNIFIDYVKIVGENMVLDKADLKTLIDEANNLYDDGKGIGASDYKKMIEEAQVVYDKDNAAVLEILDVEKRLKKETESYHQVNVSETHPIDFTYSLTNPSFENKFTGWNNTNMQAQGNKKFEKLDGSLYVEKWVNRGSKVGDANVWQTIQLPIGIYKLVLAGHNIQQNTPTQVCDGAFVYADDNKTTIGVTNDYSVKFSVLSSDINVGFQATQATGNWLAIDNFRIYRIGNMDAQTMRSALDEMIKRAKEDDGIPYNIEVKNKLESLIKAISDLNTSSVSDEDVVAKVDALKQTVSDRTDSKAEHTAVKSEIDKANAIYDASKKGAADLKNAIDVASALYKNTSATSEELSKGVDVLEKAILAFNLANATVGTGKAVKVTETNHYVPTGATEALMRATVEGDNILESGVCWSTGHNPTVLDNKSTNKHSYNGNVYHPKGLTPATVYYLRPYVINTSYQVAYGDEVKVVTHPKGNCTWSWNNGAPTEEANTRCRTAIKQTIDYFNEWTGIMGFKLSGSYGSGTPTADCSYGGSMRIGPNASYQAIGTVLHETGHGVGVGTHYRWYNCADSRANTTRGKWLGREANEMLLFLENKKATDDIYWNGDKTHGWAHGGTMDWLVNGADKDKHSEYQYVGGCLMLWAMFIDGLCPTTDYPNGISGYTFNFDDNKKYYLMPKDAKGLGKGLLGIQGDKQLGWKPMLDTGATIDDNFAWYLEYDAENCYYFFRNAKTGQYMSHNNNASVTMKSFSGTDKPAKNEYFQLMPDRTDVTLGVGKYSKTTHGYWVTWRTNQSMKAEDVNASKGYGAVPQQSFNYSNSATQQQWIIISEDELNDYLAAAVHPDHELVLDEDFTNLDYISKDTEKEYSNSKLYLHRTLHKDKWNTIVLPVNLTATQFKATFGEEAKLAKFVGVKNDRLQFTVLDATGNGEFMEANTPYIIKPTVLATNDEAYSFKVTYENNTSEVVSVNTPYYIIDGVSLDKSNVANRDVTSEEKNGYVFKGILVQDYDGTTFINGAHCLAGDYTFNAGTLHKFQDDYGMKGFRAWFHPVETSTLAKELGVAIDGVVEDDVTSIGLPWQNAIMDSGKIYNLSGQRMDVQYINQLPSGVYIVNSKKVIVK